jgi:dTDP-4-dehydrorhamnose 3,5-epimerase
MRFIETSLPGAFVMEPERHDDERGFFARMWCAEELADHGLCPTWVQSSISHNDRAGTLRGMHYQAEPHAETKLVTCTAGAVFDVIVDLRPASPAFRRWFSLELTAEDHATVYVPPGLAHGFLTLRDDSVVQYHMSEYHHPESARGVRWDDPAFGVRWPGEPTAMSQRDREYPDFAVAS